MYIIASQYKFTKKSIKIFVFLFEKYTYYYYRYQKLRKDTSKLFLPYKSI